LQAHLKAAHAQAQSKACKRACKADPKEKIFLKMPNRTLSRPEIG
jgi:hypothetical protein